MARGRILVVRKEQFTMLQIPLPHVQRVIGRYTGIVHTLLRKEPPMKTRLSINHESCLHQLVKFAAFALLATPLFAQTYTITDLGTLGRNSNGSYSIAY